MSFLVWVKHSNEPKGRCGPKGRNINQRKTGLGGGSIRCSWNRLGENQSGRPLIDET